MYRSLLWLGLVLAGAGCGSSLVADPSADMRSISRADFEIKVRGGWAGQMIGVSFGAPTEF
jgi:hypothetical protein